MGAVTLIFGILVTVHVTQPYILLTANLDDVHTLAKQVAASPVIDQLGKLVRRASDVFKEQLNAPQHKKRNYDYDRAFRASREVPPAEGRDVMDEHNIERRNQPMDDLVSFGKNASFYLQSIKKIFEKI